MSAPKLRLTLLTLGVDDVERAARFYAALGMNRGMKKAEGVAFFEAGGAVLALWGRGDFAKDIGVKDGGKPNTKPEFSGVALAYNVEDQPSVYKVLLAAKAAGGKIVKPASRAFWGGYIGYFADPDGHLWEVAHNPGFPLDERGLIELPG
jgi:catechol 2,3-dioxygenase-like lactoylglutathione lyase family enzyme